MMDSDVIYGLIALLVMAAVWIAICMIPTSMAKKRGRSQFGWLLFSFFFSPLLGMIFLAFLGETDERRRQRIREEEEIRRSVAANN